MSLAPLTVSNTPSTVQHLQRALGILVTVNDLRAIEKVRAESSLTKMTDGPAPQSTRAHRARDVVAGQMRKGCSRDNAAKARLARASYKV